jgi:hypothetical protein
MGVLEVEEVKLPGLEHALDVIGIPAERCACERCTFQNLFRRLIEKEIQKIRNEATRA